MDDAFRRALLAMVEEDERVTAELASGRTLFTGYHTRMQEVHERNAKALDDAMKRDGWPGRARVGADGAEAAWRIAQHAIGWPVFMRRALALLEQAAEIGDVPRWQPAYLIDRIRTMEGREQVYGTQFDWDAKGELVPYPIENEAEIDARRATVGLRPLAQAMDARRKKTAESGEAPPKASEQRQQEFLDWARKAGWR
jgi:hypothetical protein